MSNLAINECIFYIHQQSCLDWVILAMKFPSASCIMMPVPVEPLDRLRAASTFTLYSSQGGGFHLDGVFPIDGGDGSARFVFLHSCSILCALDRMIEVGDVLFP